MPTIIPEALTSYVIKLIRGRDDAVTAADKGRLESAGILGSLEII